MQNAKRLKDTVYYHEAIRELNYPFGNYYLFDGFFISEINEDVIYTWENHGKIVSEEIANLYDTDGSDLVYITLIDIL